MRVLATDDPTIPRRVAVQVGDGATRPGGHEGEPRELHREGQDMGRPDAGINPIVPAQLETREIAPPPREVTNEEAENAMITLYDQATAAGAIELRNPAPRGQGY